MQKRGLCNLYLDNAKPTEYALFTYRDLIFQVQLISHSIEIFTPYRNRTARKYIIHKFLHHHLISQKQAEQVHFEKGRGKIKEILK